jgi:hypothetical protein
VTVQPADAAFAIAASTSAESSNPTWSVNVVAPTVTGALLSGSYSGNSSLSMIMVPNTSRAACNTRLPSSAILWVSSSAPNARR